MIRPVQRTRPSGCRATWPTWRITWIALAAIGLSTRAHAVADRYEASVTVRPLGSIGRITERAGDVRGGEVVVSRNGGGGEVGLSYGVRNWLDVGSEVVGAGFAQAIYDPASVTVAGSPATGHLTRTTRLVQLRAGATLRLGVGWVPILHVGLGVGGRVLGAGVLRDEDHARTFVVTPDGMTEGVAIEVLACARIGFEHRLDRRWGVGVSTEASYAVGAGMPPLEVVSAGVSLSYTWYPLVQP